MIVLLLFAFIAGFVTILSPCILPILPVVLSGSVDTGKKRPFGIVAGFIASFTFFTLFLSTIVKATGVSANSVRYFAVITIFLFGISMIIPQIQLIIERAFTIFSRFGPKGKGKSGFFGGFLIGLSLGLVWTPCVGPILASVISLALVGDVSSAAFLITFSYALGTAIPMLVITYTGQRLFKKIPWLLSNTKKIQQGFGVLMLLTALAIAFNFDRKFQTYILTAFPQYGTGLTAFEDNKLIDVQLQKLSGNGEEIDDEKGEDEMSYEMAPEIVPGGEWFNSEPTTLEELRGKVVLVDFWTYSCINCIRTLPYLNDWHEKYADKGLVILGVHAPEFEFEKSASNVAKAIDDFGIPYPVVQDNDFKTWRAYKNRFWPAKYLIDSTGRIRYTYFGEGKYQETEMMIQKLLDESGTDVNGVSLKEEVYQNTQGRTPELYLGYDRIEYLASPEKIIEDSSSYYSYPPEIDSDFFAYDGRWMLSEEYAQPARESSLKLNFMAKSVNLVMLSADGSQQSVRVLIDGKVIDQSIAGEDVDQNGIITVTTDRLYSIVTMEQSGNHILELEFLDGSTQIFAFTFG